jgi:hypothetical protein
MRCPTVLSLVALALALGGCGQFTTYPPAQSCPPAAAVVELPPEAGAATDLVRGALARGDVVVLAIFTKQGPASEPALTTLGHLTDQFKGGGLTVVALEDGKPMSADQFYAADAKYRQTMATDYHPDIADAVGLPIVPLVIVIDREGIARYVHTNLHDDQIEIASVQQEILALSPKSTAQQLSEAGKPTRVISQELGATP